MTRHADTVITAAAVLLPGRGVLTDGAVAIVNGSIAAVGPALEVSSEFEAAVTVDGGSSILSPGLIDAHTHLALSFARALPPFKGHPVYDVFWPLETNIDPDLVHAFARASVAEALLAGVTTVADHYFFADATAAATTSLGIRGLLGQTIIRYEGPQASEQSLADAVDFAERQRATPLVHPAMTPHALDTVGDDWIVAAAGAAAAMDIPVHLHVAQSEREVEQIARRSGRTPIAQLDRLGVLDQRTIAAHCMYADDDDIVILAASGLVHPIYCPTVHAGLGKVMAATRLHSVGSPIGIGTDAAPSERYDVLAEARAGWAHQAVLATVSGGADGSLAGSEIPDDDVPPTHDEASDAGGGRRSTERSREHVLTLDTMFDIATEGNAKALGLGTTVGRIEPGFAADLVMWRTDRAVAAGMGDARRFVVGVAGPDVVENVWVAGDRVVSGGSLVRAEESEIVGVANEARITLFARAGL